MPRTSEILIGTVPGSCPRTAHIATAFLFLVIRGTEHPTRLALSKRQVNSDDLMERAKTKKRRKVDLPVK